MYMYKTVSAAKHAFGDDLVVLDAELNKYSWEVIGLRKGKYLLLYVWNWPWAAAKLLLLCWTMPCLITLLIFLRLAQVLFAYFSRTRTIDTSHDIFEPLSKGVIPVLFWAALLFFLGKMCLLLLVICPDSRFVLPTSILFSSFLAVLIFREASRIIEYTKSICSKSESTSFGS
jgi:hypothetical protein